MIYLKKIRGRGARGRRFAGFAAGLALAAGLLHADIVPDAPIVNFRLPMFGDDGFRIWDLRGDEGRYIDENRVDVLGMELTVYSETEPDRVETRIQSPQANMYLRRNEARGTGHITVEGDHYVIRGKNWHWEGAENRVTIDEEVEVLFSEDITGLFR